MATFSSDKIFEPSREFIQTKSVTGLKCAVCCGTALMVMQSHFIGLECEIIEQQDTAAHTCTCFKEHTVQSHKAQMLTFPLMVGTFLLSRLTTIQPDGKWAGPAGGRALPEKTELQQGLFSLATSHAPNTNPCKNVEEKWKWLQSFTNRCWTAERHRDFAVSEQKYVALQ